MLMKRFNVLLLFFCLSNILFAQNNFNQLFKKFRTSIELPYYYKSKVLHHGVADNILDLNIIDGKMIIKYTMPGDRKKDARGYYISSEVRDLHIFTIEIDIANSKLEKGDYANTVSIVNDEGITINNSIKDELFKDTFLMNWFMIRTNSQALKDKLYNEINKAFAPYNSKPKKNNGFKPKNETMSPKKSKSGKYGE